MYAWRVDTLITGGNLEGKTIQSLTITSTPSYEDAASLATNMQGIAKEVNLLGYLPGTAPSTITGVKTGIWYGAIAYKHPISKDATGEKTSVRQIITDWNQRLDLNLGKAWKPELAIGPLSPEPGDPPEMGRLAVLANLTGGGSSVIQEFLEVISAEVFRGEVPTEDMKILFIRDQGTLAQL